MGGLFGRDQGSSLHATMLSLTSAFHHRQPSLRLAAAASLRQNAAWLGARDGDIGCRPVQQ